MACLFCRHWRLARPADWKPSYEREWDQDEARRHVREVNRYLEGECCLYPVRVKVRADHVCGLITFMREVGYSWRDLRQQPREGEALVDWAASNLKVFFNGSYEHRRRVEAEKDNTELRRQLKVSRERAAKRLERLKQKGAA